MYKAEQDKVFVRKSNDFDLKQIAQSGQCFRLKVLSNNKFIAITQNHFVLIVLNNDIYEFNCSLSDFETIWFRYFDLKTDYSKFQKTMMEDWFLKEAIEYGGGIRILNQDLWEMIVTFIISQRNNIPRIQKSVDILCREYGKYLGTICDEDIYSFPTKEQLAGKDLSIASLGYRTEYIKKLCLIDDLMFEKLEKQDDVSAKTNLLQIKGIGEKVANCILLFGLHRMNSYPIDVWIKRLIDDIYNGDFNPDKYEGYAGYVQQLQFYYYCSISKCSK